MSRQPIMIAPGQMASGRVTAPVGAPPVASLETQTATSAWESPRWRNPDAAAQHLVEQERRFRNIPAQGQRGAIDENLTIAH